MADALVAVNPADLDYWVQALRPVGTIVCKSVGAVFRDPARMPLERELATHILLITSAISPDRFRPCSWTPSPGRS